MDYIRKYGFDEEFQANYTMDDPHDMSRIVTDLDIEKRIARLVGETRELLSKHEELLKGLSIELCLKGSLEASEVAEIAKRYGVSTLVQAEGHMASFAYDTALSGA
jgi:hypothetical protein